MALFSECMESCAQIVLDTAVSVAIFEQLGDFATPRTHNSGDI
jgi:hypothetical protein